MGESSAIFECIDELRKTGTRLSVKEMCALAGVSRSGYYGWLEAADAREEREQQDRRDFELILEVYNRSGYSKGVKSIHMGLLHRDPPVVMNVKKIRRIMRKYNLMCPIRKPSPYRKMAKAVAQSSVAPNILEREFESCGPRAVLLTDITYLHYGKGETAYLSAIMDAYTKEILAWQCSESMEVQFVLDTLEMLDERHGKELPDAALIHSDQGAHYTSHAFRGALGDRDLIQSMSRRGNCWDNQPMEYFFGGLKDHIRLLVAACGSFEGVVSETDRYMEYYNHERCQWKLAKLAPCEFYEFCTTGIYPLQIENPPQVPQPLKDTEDLQEKARRILAKKERGAGTEASDSTLDTAPGETAPSGQRLPQ